MPLLRSLLFAPGNVARRVEKALSLEADAVIVDLEDSVAVSEKEATRKPVAEALSRPRKCLGYVRVNAPSSPFCYGDLAATIHKGVDGVLLPKVESAAAVHEVLRVLDEHDAPARLALWCMLETPRGVLRAEEIAAASARGGPS